MRLSSLENHLQRELGNVRCGRVALRERQHRARRVLLGELQALIQIPQVVVHHAGIQKASRSVLPFIETSLLRKSLMRGGRESKTAPVSRVVSKCRKVIIVACLVAPRVVHVESECNRGHGKSQKYRVLQDAHRVGVEGRVRLRATPRGQTKHVEKGEEEDLVRLNTRVGVGKHSCLRCSLVAKSANPGRLPGRLEPFMPQAFILRTSPYSGWRNESAQVGCSYPSQRWNDCMAKSTT